MQQDAEAKASAAPDAEKPASATPRQGEPAGRTFRSSPPGRPASGPAPRPKPPANLVSPARTPGNPPPKLEPKPSVPPAVPPRAPDVALPRPEQTSPEQASAPPVSPGRRGLLPLGTIGRRTAALCVLLVATLAVAAGAVVLDNSSSPAGTAASTPMTSAPSSSASVPAVPGATVPAQPEDVLAGLYASAPQPSPAGLRRVLGPLLRTRGLGGSVTAAVVDLATGASLLTMAPDRAAVPASSAKLLTGAAALSLLGPSGRLATTVVDGGTDEIVLVGGGDVTLAAGSGRPGGAVGRAGIGDLADATAARLRAQGRRSVAVRLDDTLFKGPTTSSAWSAGDVGGGFIAPVTALAVNSGSATPAVPLVPGEPAARVNDPSMAAARLFAAALGKDGITVTGRVVRAKAPAGATELARVESATIADLVEHALTDSDNTIAEALARMVAVKAGRQATFADAGVAVLDRVDLLGVPTAGAHLSGGSGLGGGNEISARALAELLVLAASPQHPELRALLSGLPVAGASGTLADRFTTDQERPGLGLVRAKTGTLTGVSSLAGTVVDADGRQLGFAILADGVSSTLAARSALDAAAAALAACGCR